MNEVTFRDIRVHCPGKEHWAEPEKMQIRLVNTLEHGWFPAPCQGCNSMNGLMPCNKCCALITDYFWKNPTLIPLRPLRLHLSTGQIELSEEPHRR